MMTAVTVLVTAGLAEAAVIEYLWGALAFIMWVSDLMFPFWLAKWYGYGRRRRWSMAASWLLASGFVYLQAFVVAHTVGWNIGAYAMMIPSFLFIELFKPEHLVWSDLPQWIQLSTLYLISLLWFVIIPAVGFYLYSKRKAYYEA